MISKDEGESELTGSVVPPVAGLVIPESLRHASDPLGSTLALYLGRLEESLRASEGRIDYVAGAWALREVVDFLGVVMASMAVAPLSPSDAPLPGWRRSLWRTDFAEAASGLLGWAVSYLPKRGGKNPLVAGILNFLYADYERNAGAVGEARPYAGLLGLGNSSNYGQVPWNIWKERFFSARRVEELPSLAEGMRGYLPPLSALLTAWEGFIGAWKIEVEERKGGGRIVLACDSFQEELPPFLVMNPCSLCRQGLSLQILVAPCQGQRFLYREAQTTHLSTIEVEPLFKRRFFTATQGKERSAPSTTGTGEAEVDVIPLVTESVEDLRARLVKFLGQEVLRRWHWPLLAAVCEAQEALPLDLLRYSGFGVRDAEFVAYRLNGLVAFGEGDVVEPRNPQVVELCRETYPELCRLANRQLAMWAESVLQPEVKFSPLITLAARHLATWAQRSQDEEFKARLLRQSSFMPAVQAWFKQVLAQGTPEERKLVLEVSQGLLDFFASGNVAEVSEPLVELCLFRCEAFKYRLEYDRAKKELDRALEFIKVNDRNRLVKAKVLGERARLNLELELPRLAAEDAAQAVEIWAKLADIGAGASLLHLVEISRLRAEAQLALGQRSQAISSLQKVAERKVNPRTPEERYAWMGLNLQLAELLGEHSASTRQARLRFEDVLRYSQDLEETPSVLEAKAKALRGLIDDKDHKRSAQYLEQARLIFERLTKEGRNDLRPAYGDVIYRLAFLMEKMGRLDECLVYTEQAIAIFTEFVASSELYAHRAALAKLWLLRSRIEELRGNYVEAEGFIAKSLEYYQGLLQDNQVRFIADYAKVLAKRGSLRVLRQEYAAAKEDLELSIEKWPGAHDLKNARAPLARVFLNLAVSYARLGNIPSALSQFEKGLVISENRNDRNTCCQVLSERVWVFFYDGQFKRAEDDFSTIFNLRSEEANQASQLLGRGVARLQQEKNLPALSDFSQILMQGEEVNLSALLGSSLAHLGQGEREGTRSNGQKLLQKAPPLAELNLEGVTRVCMAHWVLAQSLAEDDLAAALQHSASACQLWSEKAQEDPNYLAEEEIFRALSVFFLQFPQLLFRGVQLLVKHGKLEGVVEPLRSARNLGIQSAIFKLLPNYTFEVGLELVKVYTKRRQTLELAQLTEELLREYGDSEESEGEHTAPGTVEERAAIVAGLYLNILRLLWSQCERLEEGWQAPASFSFDDLLGWAKRGLAAYERLSGLGLSFRQRAEFAECNLLRGLIEQGAGQLVSAGAAWEKSRQLYEDLRQRSGGKGYELELCSVLLKLISLAEKQGDGDRAFFLLDELLVSLRQLPELPRQEANLRQELVNELASLGAQSFVQAAGDQDLIGELLTLPLWQERDLVQFETALCNSLQGQLRRGIVNIVGHLIVSWSQRNQPGSETRLGEKLLGLWLEQALEEGARRGESGGLALLEQLVSLGEDHPELSQWQEYFAVRAQEGVADFYASEGNYQTSIDLLGKAQMLVGEDGSPEAVALRAHLGIRRAELYLKAGLYTESQAVLQEAELSLQGLPAYPPGFKDRIDHVRIDLFLRGQMNAKREKKATPPPVSVAPESGDLEEESPLAKLVRQESSAARASGAKEEKRSLADGLLAVGSRLFGRLSGDSSKEEGKSAASPLAELPSVVAAEVAPPVEAPPPPVSLESQPLEEPAVPAPSAEEIPAEPAAPEPVSEVPSSSSRRRIIPQDVGMEVAVYPEPQLEDEPPAPAEEEAPAPVPPALEAASQEPAWSEPQAAPEPSPAEESLPAAAAPESVPLSFVTAESAAAEPLKEEAEVALPSQAGEESAAPASEEVESPAPAAEGAEAVATPIVEQEKEPEREDKAPSLEAEAAEPSLEPQGQLAPAVPQEAERLSASSSAPEAPAPASSPTTSQPAEKVTPTITTSPPPKKQKKGVDMAELSARLSAKLARRSRPSPTKSLETLAREAADNEDHQGALPTTETRKISIKGAVSDAQFEKLTQKAAAAPVEEPKVIDRKVYISIPDSVRERMEYERLMKERLEAREAARQAALEGRPTPEEEERAARLEAEQAALEEEERQLAEFEARLKESTLPKAQPKAAAPTSLREGGVLTRTRSGMGGAQSGLFSRAVGSHPEGGAAAAESGKRVGPEEGARRRAPALEDTRREVREPARESGAEGGRRANGLAQPIAPHKRAAAQAANAPVVTSLRSTSPAAGELSVKSMLRNLSTSLVGQTPRRLSPSSEKLAAVAEEPAVAVRPAAEPSYAPPEAQPEPLEAAPELTAQELEAPELEAPVLEEPELEAQELVDQESESAESIGEESFSEEVQPPEAEFEEPAFEEEPILEESALEEEESASLEPQPALEEPAPEEEAVLAEEPEQGAVSAAEEWYQPPEEAPAEVAVEEEATPQGAPEESPEYQEEPSQEYAPQASFEEAQVQEEASLSDYSAQPAYGASLGGEQRQTALAEIDQAFAQIDGAQLELAEDGLRRVGQMVEFLEPTALGEVMAGFLEGMHSLGFALSERQELERAGETATYAAQMGRYWLADSYDAAAWPWWGDIERQLGQFMVSLGRFEEATQAFNQAIDIYLKLIDLDLGEPSRVDALNVMLELGQACEYRQDNDGAVSAYSEAITQGETVLTNGFPEEMIVAEAFRRRAELYILAGYWEAAGDDLAWTLEYYARDTTKSGERHLLEIAAVRLRLGEVYFICGRQEEALGCREELTRMLDYFRRYRRETEAQTLDQYLQRLDETAAQYMSP